MIRSTRKLLAAFIAAAMLMVMTACSNYKQYDHLKTDILGIWCGEEGPDFEEYIGEDGLDYSRYFAYEFTPDGQLVYHYTYVYLGGTSQTNVNYSISDNLLDVEGAKCRIDIQDGILSMTSNEGTNRYRKMTVDELVEYVVDPINPEIAAQKEERVAELMAEYEATATEEGSSESETEGAASEETQAAETEGAVSEETQAVLE